MSDLNDLFEKYKLLYHLFKKDMKNEFNLECSYQIENKDIYKMIIDFNKNDNKINTELLIFKYNEINLNELNDKNSIFEKYIKTFTSLSKTIHDKMNTKLTENPKENIFENIFKNSSFDMNKMLGVLDDIGIDFKSLLNTIEEEKDNLKDEFDNIEDPFSINGIFKYVEKIKPIVEKTVKRLMTNINIDEENLKDKLPDLTNMVEKLQENPEIKKLLENIKNDDGELDVSKIMSNFGLEKQISNVLGMNIQDDKMKNIMKGFSDYMKHNPNDGLEDDSKNPMNMIDMVKNIQNMITPQKKTMQEIQQQKENKKKEKMQKRLQNRLKLQQELKKKE